MRISEGVGDGAEYFAKQSVIPVQDHGAFLRRAAQQGFVREDFLEVVDNGNDSAQHGAVIQHQSGNRGFGHQRAIGVTQLLFLTKIDLHRLQ